jgi:integrase
MGQLRKRGEVWWIRYYRDGRRYEESSHSTLWDDAKRLLKIREGDVARGLPVSPKIGRLRFDEAAEDLLNDYTINKKRTLNTVRCRITLHLEPYFGNRRMSTITTPDIRAYIAERQKSTVLVRKARNFELPDGSVRHVEEERRPVSNGEINRELTALKRMFRLALQAGKLLAIPYVPMLRENNVRTGFFEAEQFASVLKNLPAEIQPIARFAYITGWRIPSEVLPLEWRQVDLKGGELRLDPGTTKNDEGRVFPLTTELRRLLEEQKASAEMLQRENGKILLHVFFQASGRRIGEPVSESGFILPWREACRLAGCPGRIPHDLRRTAVRNLVRAGVPERVAMKLTGHKTRSVFERYNIVSETDLLEAVRRLSEADVRYSSSSTRSK